jgi:mono/diheme cytochrome c family protein
MTGSIRRFAPTAPISVASGLAVLALAAVSCSSRSPSGGAVAAADTAATAEHGAYLATISGCHDCHTPGTLYGKPDFQRALSGSELGWQTPAGVAYAPNLTPDPITGLGAWSEADIIRALQSGKRPDGTDVRPPMPWPNFAHMTSRDVRSIALYLKSVVPVTHTTPKSGGAILVLPPPPAWDIPPGDAAGAPAH